MNATLRDSIFQWDKVVDAMEDCVFLMDANFKVVRTNKACRDFLGKTDDDIIGKHCWELAHGTIESPDFCPMTKMMKSKKRESADIELAGRYVRVTIDPILDEDGSIKGAVHIIRDIDESERKNIVIRESEKKYHELVDTMSDVVFTLDFDGGIIDTSPTMKRIIGWSKEEAIGKRFSDFVHPDDIPRAEEEFLRAIQGIGRPLEIRVIPLNGAPRWIRINALLIMKDGEPDNLLCVLSDIQEKKLAEDALRESEKRYRLLVESATDAILVSQDGVIRLVNPMTVTITGFSEQELMSKPFLSFIHPEDREIVSESYQKRIRGEAVPARYAVRMLSKDGSIKWVEVSAVKIDWEGRPATLGFVTDITERKQTMKRLQESEEDLKAAAENLTRINTSLIDAKLRSQTYFDFLAHDIANILSPIMAYAELMSKGEQYPPEIISFTGKIVDQAQKATSLIHNLRKLEMLEEKNLPDMNIVDIKRIFSFVENSIRHKYPEKNPTFAYHLPEDIPIKSRGGEYIDFVIRHVFDNAVRHAQRDTINIDVRIDKEGENVGGKFWRILIEDDGPGISDRLKKEITTPLDPTKRYSRGVASSLAFCSAAVIGIGGELQIEDRVPNDQSKGTRVIVWIPVYD